MKIQYASDLHLEFMHSHSRRPAAGQIWHLPRTEADVIVLAGDIWYHVHAIWWIAEEAKYQEKPILFVFGNHDYWNDSRKHRHGLDSAIGVARAAAARYRRQGAAIYFLEDDAIAIDGTRFLGCTLWTDYLAGNPQAMAAARKCINDFVTIPGKSAPADFLRIHQRSVAWLDRQLAEPFAGDTVVVTHHAPHARSMHRDAWEGTLDAHTLLVDGAYVTDLTWLIEFHQPALWIHGHTHEPADYRIGRTRIVHNPRGYGADGEWIADAIADRVVAIEGRRS